MLNHRITGTKEWAVTTINCCIGCNRGCRYCFARKIALRRGDINSPAKWEKTNIINRNLLRENNKYNGTVMFPSMHDITVDNLEVCLATLHNLLKAGNKVLITSKPEIDCITEICKLLDIYKDKILFRFTIGTSYNDILELWEPGAPTFEERFCCLTYAFVKGYKTSISMEPMLNCKSIAGDVRMMLPFVTDSIWIGKMNKIESRVCNIPSSEVDRIRQNQADDEIRLLYNELKYYSKVKWKDSCKEVLNLKRPSKIGQDI